MKKAILFVFLAFALLSGCDKTDYVAIVQNHDSTYPGVKVKEYVEQKVKESKAAGNKLVVTGWTQERVSGGHIVRFLVAENGRDRSFIWLVDDDDNVQPYNDMAKAMTHR